MSDIFEEVEESLSKDQWTERWEKYGIFVYITVALVVGYVAFLEWQKVSATAKNTDRIETYEAGVAALDDGNYQEAISLLRPLAEEGSPLSPMAAHQVAQALLFEADHETASQILQNVGDADGHALEQLAVLKAAYLVADNSTVAELEALMGDLIEVGSKARTSYIGSLGVELIAAKSFEEGDFARARELYRSLSVSIDATPSITQRAQLALLVIPDTDESVVPEQPAEGETVVEGETP